MKKRHTTDYPKPQLQTVSKPAVFVMDNTPEGLAKDKALLNAFMQEDVEAVKELLKSADGVRGANPNVTDEFGRTLYHLAKRWGWRQMRTVLYQHGGRVIHHSFPYAQMSENPKPIQIIRSSDNAEHMAVLYQDQHIKG